MGKKLSYQEVKEYIESYGCELLSEKYVNNEAKLRIKCKCGNIFEKSYINFKHGGQRQCVKCSGIDMSSKLGEIREMGCGELAEIIEYTGVGDITVKILGTGEIIKANYGNFKKGNIKSHFSPTVYGWGIIGTEKTRDDNGSMLKSYRVWSSMIGRCYGEVYNKRNPNYIGCEVCEEWRLYSNFKKWFDENYYTLEDEDVQLDKDLLCNKLELTNKLYSPNTCLFLPKSINTKLRELNKNRKFQVLPSGKFRMHLPKEFRGKGIKEVYNTYEEALEVHLKFRVSSIRKRLEYYKDKIPSEVYEIVYNIDIK